jgi:hypothetical protein
LSRRKPDDTTTSGSGEVPEPLARIWRELDDDPDYEYDLDDVLIEERRT